MRFFHRLWALGRFGNAISASPHCDHMQPACAAMIAPRRNQRATGTQVWVEAMFAFLDETVEPAELVGGFQRLV